MLTYGFLAALVGGLWVVRFFCCRWRICPLSHHPWHARVSVFPSEARILVYDQEQFLGIGSTIFIVVLAFAIGFGTILFLQAQIPSG